MLHRISTILVLVCCVGWIACQQNIKRSDPEIKNNELRLVDNDIWPCRRHDAARTGRSPFTVPEPTGVKWFFTLEKCERTGISTLAIDVEGIIYVGFGSKFYAITPEGKKKWDFTTESFVTSSPAVGPNGTIYFGTLRHRFYALNPDGSVKWTYDLVGAEFISSPVIGIDGAIYVGTAMASDISGEWPVAPRLLVLTPEGKKKWEFLNEPDGIEDDIFSSPAIGKDGTIFFGTYDNDVFAVTAEGKKKWVFATGDYVDEGATVGSDGTVYVGSNDETFYAISPDGTKKWSIVTGDVSFYPSISSKGIVYVSGKDKLLAVEADGTIKWQIPVITAGQLAVDGEGTVIFGATDDKIHAVGPDGKELWSLDVGERLVDPAIGADGTVYFVSHKPARVYAIGRK